MLRSSLQSRSAPNRLCAARSGRTVHPYLTHLAIGGGPAEAVAVVGKALADLELPRDATVVAVMRKSRVLPPRAEIELATGDEILLLATTDAEEAVYRLLVGP